MKSTDFQSLKQKDKTLYVQVLPFFVYYDTVETVEHERKSNDSPYRCSPPSYSDFSPPPVYKNEILDIQLFRISLSVDCNEPLKHC